MPTISSAQEARAFIENLEQKQLKAPSIRQNLTQTKPGSFMDWLQQETVELQRIAQKETPDKVLATPQLRERFEAYYEIFMTVEKSFNGVDIAGNKAFGTTMSQGLVKKLAASPQFATQFLDIVSLDKRQQFEALVYSAIPDRVAKGQDALGLRDILSNLPPSMLSPANVELMDAFLQTLEKTEVSRRFEMMARIDAYIRSGHARNDLESDSEDGKALRQSLKGMTYTPGTTPDIIKLKAAREALFNRFDELFHVVQIKNDMAIDKGIFTIQPDYKTNRRDKNGMPACMQTASAGTVDVAILKHGEPGKWLWTTVTATLNHEHISVEGEQTTRHHRASKNMVFENGDKYSELKNQSVEMTLLYAAQINVNSKASKIAKNIGADTDSKLLQAVNDLVPLTMMSNKKDTSTVEEFRLVCAGAPANPRLETDIGVDTHAAVSADIIITALNGLLAAEVQQGKLTIRSKFDESLKFCAQLINAYDGNTELLDKAPAKAWRGLIEQMYLSTEQGDFHGLKAVRSAVQGLQLRQMEYQAEKAEKAEVTSDTTLAA